jgi:heme iron utilization protein
MKEPKRTIPDRAKKGTVSVADRVSALNKVCPHAVLATDAAGQPYTSLVAYALTPDIQGVVFITPKTTRKYRNILKNPRVSLLIDTRTNTPKDYMQAESVTILGNARLIRRGKTRTELADIFMKKHPKLEGIIHSRETALIFIKLTRCIHVTKFQSVSVWDMR